MSNDQRYALENAIVAYGAAKALEGFMSEDLDRRALARDACIATWEKVEEILDRMDAASGVIIADS